MLFRSPEGFQDMFFGLYQKYVPTSMNTEATGGGPKVLDTETSCVFFSQFWIRRRQYQTQRHVAKIRVILDEF